MIEIPCVSFVCQRMMRDVCLSESRGHAVQAVMGGQRILTCFVCLHGFICCRAECSLSLRAVSCRESLATIDVIGYMWGARAQAGSVVPQGTVVPVASCVS